MTKKFEITQNKLKWNQWFCFKSYYKKLGKVKNH